jgi:hypothetical protein
VLWIAMGAVTGACVGCGRTDERGNTGRSPTTGSASNVSVAESASVAGATGTRPKPICPATGRWQICSVVERLERAGLAPRQDSGRVNEAPLSTPGIAIQLGRSELRIFVYVDRAARERDQAKLDATKYVSANEPLSMQAEPTLIASENLLAILRSRSDHQRERVSDALTAGPPQSPRTKG